MFWIPQQLSYFRAVPPGVWTVCYHINRWNQQAVKRFVQDLDRYASMVGSIQEIQREWTGLDPHSGWLRRRPRLSPLLIRCELKFWDICEQTATQMEESWKQ